MPQLVADPDLHLMVGGRRVEAMLRDDSFVFPLVLPCGEMRLMSRASRPSEVGGGADDRLLGFRVRTLTLVCDGRPHAVPLDHPALGDGLHAIEHTGMRWTDGAAALAAGGAVRRAARPGGVACRRYGAAAVPGGLGCCV